jgi:serine/threonine-protein kinase HipA
MRLSPAYDLLCTQLAIPEDKEQSALSINGKRTKITRRDFDALAVSLNISEKVRRTIYKRFLEKQELFSDVLHGSLLPAALSAELFEIITTRLALFTE